MSDTNQNPDFSVSSIKSELSNLGKLIIANKPEQIKADIKDYNISDLNNFIGSNRKLIINDREEYWVHDIVLKENSKFFQEILTKSPQVTSRSSIRNDKINIQGSTINRTFIEVPHAEYFFDILTWFYSKDIKRLSLIADDQESYISILSLGVFLGLKQEFFDKMIQSCEIKLDEKLIKSDLWSRFSFPFSVLKNFVELIPKENNFMRILALLTWLKEDNKFDLSDNSVDENEIEKKEFELLTSDEYLSVKDYIHDNKMCENLNINHINTIKIQFPNLINALDLEYLIEKFIEKNTRKITCKICKKQGTDLHLFMEKKCEEKLYHPKRFIQLQRQITNKCAHLGCKNKIAINEYPCCHQQNVGEGCLLSDGNHILSIH